MNIVKGDVVYLKSGSPAMTVRSISVNGEVQTNWFVEHHNMFAIFGIEQLTEEHPYKVSCEVIQGK